MQKKIKGEPNHPFVKEMQALVKDNADVHDKIVQARLIYASRVVRTQSFEEEMERCGLDVPNDCVWNEFGSLKTLRPYQIEIWIKGSRVPENEGQIRRLGLDYGVTGEELEQFIARGKAYMEHCKNLAQSQPWTETVEKPEPAKTPERKPKEKFAAKVTAEKPEQKSKQETEQKITTKMVLENIMAGCSMASTFDRTITKGVPKSREETVKPSVLVDVHLRANPTAKGLLNGTRPNGSGNKTSEKKVLDRILDVFFATPEERAAAHDAYDADVARLNGLTHVPRKSTSGETIRGG